MRFLIIQKPDIPSSLSALLLACLQQNHDSRQTLRDAILIESCKVLPDIARVIYQGFRQRQKWSWNDFQEYPGRSLLDIRSEFDIAIV